MPPQCSPDENCLLKTFLFLPLVFLIVSPSSSQEKQVDLMSEEIVVVKLLPK